MIFYVIDRCRRVEGIDQIILATSNDETDTKLTEYARSCGIHVFRGSLDNVQRRFFEAAVDNTLDVIIRVTGDNPLVSPELMEKLLKEWELSQAEYIAFKQCTYGTGAELFTLESFRHVINLHPTSYDKEHVTPPYYQRKELFATLFLDAPNELYGPDLCLSVDKEADFILMEKVYNKYSQDNYVLLKDVIQGVKDAKTLS